MPVPRKRLAAERAPDRPAANRDSGPSAFSTGSARTARADSPTLVFCTFALSTVRRLDVQPVVFDRCKHHITRIIFTVGRHRAVRPTQSANIPGGSHEDPGDKFSWPGRPGSLRFDPPSGELAALRVVRASEKSGGYDADLDLPGLLATLREQGEAVNAGNLAQAEAMLMNQATALQTVFARLVERGMGCTEIPAFEVNLRMGLRAQAQCRATLETLAAIKNPASVAFVRQANIAHGPQQVNNGTPAPSRARENGNRAKQTFGGEQWRTAGHRNGERDRQR